MNNPNASFADLPVSEKKFPWGCLLGGCATVLLLMVLGTAATIYGGFRLVRGQVEMYTSDQPVEIPVVSSTPEETAAVWKRIDDFKAALEKGDDQPPLVLTADDINVLISSEKELAGRLFVKIEEGEITGEASFPADAIPFGKGRYFNGSVSLKASLQDGIVVVALDQATVNGKPVPEEAMNGMRNQNLAKDAFNDPKAAEFLRKFESLTIQNDSIILIPAKQKPTLESDQPTGDLITSDPAAQAEITELPTAEPTDPN